MRKIQFCFFMLRKLLGFDRMHENKTFVFCFLKEKINLKILKFFFNFQKKLETFRRKSGILIPDLYLMV